MKIWPSGEGTDISLSNSWGVDRLWVVLWKSLGHGIIHPKMPWYYIKKSILYSILCTQNTPTLCSNTPLKMGYFRCDSRGIYVTGTYPRSRNSWKYPSRWNNQFSMGVLHFYSIKNSIDLIGTCLKILQCPVYVHDKTGTLLLVHLAMLLSRCLFLPHHDASGHWLLQVPSPQRRPIQVQRPCLAVLGNVAYVWFGRISVGG